MPKTPPKRMGYIGRVFFFSSLLWIFFLLKSLNQQGKNKPQQRQHLIKKEENEKPKCQPC